MTRIEELLYQLCASGSVCYTEELPPSQLLFFDQKKCEKFVESTLQEIESIHAQALYLSESRGVKKGMMKAAEIAKREHLRTDTHFEDDKPALVLEIYMSNVEIAIRTQAESEEVEK